jgi:DNA-binding NtrC family response regulator
MLSAAPNVLLVDDDAGYLDATSTLAEARGCCVFPAATMNAARNAARERAYDLALVDMVLPDGNGLDLLNNIALNSNGHAVVLTGCPSVEMAVDSMRRSACDYLVKPIQRTKLEQLLGDAVANAARRSGMADDYCGDLFGRSTAMHQLFERIRRVAPLDVTVLLHGESGTGKELAARALHACSGRKGKLISVNCGAVASELLVSQLFGHERGSFTGAVRDHPGYFEQAEHGTLFLDEITEMPLDLQAHLLRVLEEPVVTRLGATTGRRLDVRVVAACNRVPSRAVREGRLRPDLYYRLMDCPLRMPSLREHRSDIPALAQHFLDRLNRRYATRRSFAPDAMARLLNHDWPGNVRELHHAVQRAFVLSDNEVKVPPLEGLALGAGSDDTDTDLDLHVGMTLQDMEKRALLRTLAYFDNDKARTAEVLGISLKTVYNKLARYGHQA